MQPAILHPTPIPLSTRRWTPDEDAELLTAVRHHGDNWDAIHASISNGALDDRTPRICRERHSKLFAGSPTPAQDAAVETAPGAIDDDPLEVLEEDPVQQEQPAQPQPVIVGKKLKRNSEAYVKKATPAPARRKSVGKLPGTPVPLNFPRPTAVAGQEAAGKCFTTLLGYKCEL